MKIRNLLGVLLISLMLLGSTQTVFAQELDEREIRKELRVIMEELPVEAQQDILRYAEAKRAMVRRQAEVAAQPKPSARPGQAPTEAAQPTPAATPAQVQVNPSQSATAGRTTGHAPQRPAYMVEAEKMEPTTVEWYAAEHDFGEIKSGETVRHTYRFKNTGDQPLHLTRVKASCGCTTPSYSRDPIAPGEEGFIEVAFNSTGKRGTQRKTVVVTGNFEPVNMILRFQGNVVQE